MPTEMEQFIYLFEPVRPELITDPNAWTEDEISVAEEHFSYLERATEAGQVILAGRALDGEGPGLVIIEAESEEVARAFMEADPFVAMGLMNATLHPFRAALVQDRTQTPSRRQQSVRVRPLSPEDEEWAAQFIRNRWGSNRMVAHGNLYLPHTLPGFLAFQREDRVGLLTYHIQGDSWEIVTIDSAVPGQGVGTALLQAVKEAARSSGARRLWLITTNDNLNALRFYQKRGFKLVAVRPNALEFSRQLKPEIPLVGEDGIPLRDEIELEMDLGS